MYGKRKCRPRTGQVAKVYGSRKVKSRNDQHPKFAWYVKSPIQESPQYRRNGVGLVIVQWVDEDC